MIVDPSNQKKLYGHSYTFNQLKKLYQNDKFPNKIFLSGLKGIGKSTLAYHIINFILSINEDYSYDTANFEINSQNKSFTLVQNQSSPNFDLINVSKEKKNIDINQIRILISNLNKSPVDN